MNLRTPRRRISPRTKKRYRAIKNFLHRALGSSSQPNIDTNSFVSISGLKQKIVGIEEQLNTVSKHFQDLTCLDYNLRPTSTSTVTTKVEDNAVSDKDTYTKSSTQTETKVLYTHSQDQHKKHNGRLIPKKTIDEDDTKMINTNNFFYKEKRNKHDTLEPIKEGTQTRKHKNHTTVDNYHTVSPTTSYNCFHGPKTIYEAAGYSETGHHKKRNKRLYENNTKYCFTRENYPHSAGEGYRYNKNKALTNKYVRPELDQNFIADIIRRQYRPVKLFGRTESDLSQFSAPVCRDQEFPVYETLQRGSDLCSCCHGEYRHQKHSKYMCSNDVSDMRSICDTRLYSSRRHKHQINRKERLEDYNDSTMYDIVPVKEKSSPKSRRKFVEDNIFACGKYREVPPSPRTHRPRLNLQAQFYQEDDNDDFHLEKLTSKTKSPKPRQKYINHSNISSEVFIQNRNRRDVQKSQSSANTTKLYIREGLETVGSTQHTGVVDEFINNNITVRQTTGTSVEKNDKTLSEIKDILQSFLMEMKKESSQNDKLNIPSSDTQNKLQIPQSDNINVTPTSGFSYNNSNNFGQCAPPFMQSFTNPCCYPIFPICPMNCMQNGFVAPSPSYSCTACANHLKERDSGSSNNKNKTDSAAETTSTETQKLIKEIHKLILQNPKAVQNKDSHNINNTTATKNEARTTLMSRSVGGSSKASKHDAKVGTNIKCYSKSCEVIGSRLNTNAGCAANISHSDTILEKGSSEETTNAQSTSESEYSSDSTVPDKKKENKFSKILKSIGLLKKNKTNLTEKLSECDSDIVNMRPHAKPPFQQNIMNYNMHNQDYYHPPPMPPPQAYPHQHECCNNSRYPSPNTTYCSPPCVHDKSYGRYSPEHGIHHCTSPQHTQSTPMPQYANYCNPYGQVTPQVPLCLKEIEVKSIGTQSVRRMSFLKKFTNKMQVPTPKMKELSQTQSSTENSKDKAGKKVLDWKKWQAKAYQNKANTDPLKYSYKTQKRLAEGDIKMRNAMLKKLFYKRNPFSPRNLLVKTLLGKDKSSFGEPPKMYKPRMFL